MGADPADEGPKSTTQCAVCKRTWTGVRRPPAAFDKGFFNHTTLYYRSKAPDQPICCPKCKAWYCLEHCSLDPYTSTGLFPFGNDVSCPSGHGCGRIPDM
ncbi:MAG: hypothetical protein HYZ53_30220 [Planctomycetes bacterium]|nr:hypothetical protein [Planctomycetota bacterium]